MLGLATKGFFFVLISTCLTVGIAEEKGWKNKVADIYFLLDSSYSVWIGDFQKQLNFVADLVSEMDIGPNQTRIGLGTFSWYHNLIVRIDNTLSKQNLLKAITQAPYYRGNNYFSRAIQGVRQQGLPPHLARPNVPKITIFFTDGRAEYSERTRSNVTLAKKEGIFFFTVGIGPEISERELTDMASDPKRRFRYFVPNFDALASIKTSLLTNIGKVNLYQGDEATCGKNTRVDTIFIYDEAGIGLRNTQKTKLFLRNLAQNFSINPGNVRVGVFSKTCHEEKDIMLGDYVTRETFSEALDANPGPDISTIVTRAWETAFYEKNGRRPDALKRMVIIMHAEPASRKSMENIFKETWRAKTAQTEVYIIRIGTPYNKPYINAIASNPSSDHILFLDSFEQLPGEGAEWFLRTFCKDL